MHEEMGVSGKVYMGVALQQHGRPSYFLLIRMFLSSAEQEMSMIHKHNGVPRELMSILSHKKIYCSPN